MRRSGMSTGFREGQAGKGPRGFSRHQRDSRSLIRKPIPLCLSIVFAKDSR
jgi:hypothetical protein